jgi:putative ABC transport system permease protein
MIWLIAWKNVWRNKRRSLVVIAAVTIGIISGVLLVGIMQGWVEQRLHDAIYNEVSHIQVHNSEYIKNEEIDLTIKNADEIIRTIESLKGISGWVKRTKIVAMANTPWANTGVIVYGIDPGKEKEVTEIYREVLPGAGDYLNNENPGDILISDKTAELLKLKQYIVTDSILIRLKKNGVAENILVKLKALKDMRFRSPKDFRDALKGLFTKKELDKFRTMIMEQTLDYRIRNKVKITLSDLSGTPVQGVFRVCGIYKTRNTGFDQVSVFVNADELADLYDGSNIMIHEIAMMLDNTNELEEVEGRIGSVTGDNTVRSWKDLAPDAAMMNDFMIMYYFIFIGIIMLALAFGIINTMLMAILERTKELGMLMAIGMNRRRIFYMIMLETIFLTVVGAVAGILSGWAITEALGKTGIHFTGWGEGFEAIGFAARVYPVVTPEFFMFTTIMVIVTAIISSIGPARKALKLNPVEALRTE